MKKATLFGGFLLITLLSMAQQKKGFQIKQHPEKKDVSITYNGKLITSYCWYDSIKKPVLFPLNTLDGITVTRGFPLAPRPGERTDHPHHIGLWMNYESVNGLDFWNHSTAIPFEKRNGYGTILHQRISSQKANATSAQLTTTANWVRPDGVVLLDETTTYLFTVQKSILLIDRTTTLTARDTTVVFNDVKDGFLAIRVARELELPSQQADVFVDAQGNKTTVAKVDNEGVSGMYYSSTGLRGDSVWSSQAPWVYLKGKKEGKQITIGIIDHSENVGYPTYWHARGYGLFALNPLGRAVFSNGKETLHFSLAPHAAATFKYRIVVASGNEVTEAQMNAFATAFGKTK
ncbi:MAG TPA: PmoA family protein [Chitinophagaceae bacterium]|nr:PmoA family protein [Chitinophagaceae bacterium]